MSVHAGLRAFALMIRTSFTSARDAEPVIYAGTGAPSGGTLPGGQTLAATQEAIRIRAGASSPSDLLAGTIDGGTTWSAWANVGGTNDFAATVTAADELINADLSVNHATATGKSIEATAVQLTTARTSGTMAAFAGKTTSLAGDSGGTYADYWAQSPTDGGGTTTHTALLVASGHDIAIDSSGAATGETDWVVGDNLASAWEIREGANVYVRIVSTNSAERVEVAKDIVLTGTAPQRVFESRSRAAKADADATISAAEFKGGVMSMTPTTTRTLTTRTAAQMVGDYPGVVVGSTLDLEIVNLAAGQVIALAGGTGVTVVGVANVGGTTLNLSGAGRFRAIFTNVTASSEAVDLVRVG